MDINDKLEKYLDENDSEQYYPEDDVKLMSRMVGFITELESDSLDEDQIEELVNIIDSIATENLDEAIGAKKVKIDPTEKRERRREYKKNKAKLKLQAKKFRKTSKFKKYQKKKKRMAAQGKTAGGKRVRKFL